MKDTGDTGAPAKGGQRHAHDSSQDHAGHDHTGDVVWERYQKKRTFVRALEGTYGDLMRDLFDQPRVYPSRALKWKGGPQNFGKKIINPQAVKVAQSVEAHIEAVAPNGKTQKHGHMNSAVFYILNGRGYDIHDGRRIEYEAGDALIVENACVHQHFNRSSDEELVILVMKAKPLFLFMHMLFQKVVELPPKEPAPGHGGYTPPADL